MPQHVLTAGALASALVLAGCAGTPPRPDAEMNVAEAAITQAESAGARNTAPRLLKQARDKVQEARARIDEEKHAEARRLLERATADARLAGSRARTAQAEEAVRELNETIEMLRDQMMEDEA